MTKFFLPLLLIPWFGYSSTTKTSSCFEKIVKKGSTTTFINPKNKTKWAASTAESIDFFSSLGFLSQKTTDSTVHKFSNSIRCPSTESFHKLMSSPDGRWSLVAVNTCQFDLAIDLGFSMSKDENYGSMESGLKVLWPTVQLCPDSKP